MKIEYKKELILKIEEYELFIFEHKGISLPVYKRGKGAGIVLMHELPGITPKVLEFSNTLVARGFTVWMPSLTGIPGQETSKYAIAKQLVKVCIRKEFHMLAKNHSSPITGWLRALCCKLDHVTSRQGIGVLGMCFTGNFALTMMVETCVKAPVVCQPYLPIPLTPAFKRSLHLSQEELNIIKTKTLDSELKVLGLRFSDDSISPSDRFKCLKNELGNGFEEIEIDSSPGNPHHISQQAHSVLTEDFNSNTDHPTYQARERIFQFFDETLR